MSHTINRIITITTSQLLKLKTMNKSITNSTFERMVTLYHNHNPNPNQCTSTIVHKINAPVHVVWSIVRRFDKPQVYKSFLKNCTMLKGSGGVGGDVREVHVVSGMPAKVSRERLDRLDDNMHVMTYTMIEGDHRLVNYRSTTTLHEEEGGSEGETVVIESYLVNVPSGNSEEETRIFVNTVLGCNHKSLAYVSEKVAARMC